MKIENKISVCPWCANGTSNAERKVIEGTTAIEWICATCGRWWGRPQFHNLPLNEQIAVINLAKREKKTPEDLNKVWKNDSGYIMGFFRDDKIVAEWIAKLKQMG